MRQGLPLSSWSRGPRQQALPRLPCSYGLMRQSSPLLVPRLSPRTPGLCRLRSAPAGRRTFPTLLCASFPACLDPYPGSSYGARARFFPYDIDLPPVRTGSALRNVPYSDFRTALDFGAAVIPSCSGPQVCSPPRSLLPLRQHRRAAVTYYVRASRRSLPPHAPDMLAVRIGQLTAGDFHPIRCAALSAAHPCSALPYPLGDWGIAVSGAGTASN